MSTGSTVLTKAVDTSVYVLVALSVCAASLGARAADVPAHPVFFDPSAPPPSFAPSFPQPQSAAVFVTPPPSVFDWTGLHLGLTAGYDFAGRTSYALSGNDSLTGATLRAGNVPTAFATSTSGFTGGAELGFDKMLDPMLIPPLAKVGGAVVLGVEADAAYTNISAFGTTLDGIGDSTTLHGRTEFVGTVRGRVGLAFDRLLLYGTGGFAYGDINKAGNIALSNGQNFLGSSSDLQTGYAYGGGVAYAFPATPLFKAFMAPAVTVKVEYLHYDLGPSNVALTNVSGLGGAYNARSEDRGSIIRAGIDYKFALKIPAPPY